MAETSKAWMDRLKSLKSSKYMWIIAVGVFFSTLLMVFALSPKVHKVDLSESTYRGGAEYREGAYSTFPESEVITPAYTTGEAYFPGFEYSINGSKDVIAEVEYSKDNFRSSSRDFNVTLDHRTDRVSVDRSVPFRYVRFRFIIPEGVTLESFRYSTRARLF